MRNRRTFTAKFKTERVVEVLTGDFTPAQVCRLHQLNPQQLADWKAEFLANASLVFQRDRESEILEAREAASQTRPFNKKHDFCVQFLGTVQIHS